MTKSSIAEWILSQVFPPDRAASTVGDWMEDADKRGNIWFWWNVLRTAVSAIWSDFTESPRFILVLALRSSAPVTYVLVILYQILLPHFVRKALLVQCALLSVAWIVCLGVVTGRWIARRAPGREAAVCIAASLVPMVVIRLVTLFLPRFRSGPSIVAQGVVLGISLLTGALWLRRRQYHPVG
jgi:hypothetical protein